MILFLYVAFIGICGVNAQVDCAGILEVDVPVRGTFLRAIDDRPYAGHGTYEFDENLEMKVISSTPYSVEDPAIVDLVAYGFFEGDRITISYDATVYYCGVWNPANPATTECGVITQPNLWWGGVIGVFSATDELLPIDKLYRVPAAINAGQDINTLETYWSDELKEISDHLRSKSVSWYDGPMKTDIAEDFVVNPYTGMSIVVPRNAKYLFLSITDVYYRDNLGSVKVTIEKDTDEDGIPDAWEQNGIDIDCDGQIDLDLPALQADWQHKDIFVEIDYMQTHRPRQDSIDDVVAAFAKALVSNPDLIDGITLHVFVDESLPFKELLSGWGEFQSIKASHFGTVLEQSNPKIIQAKKQVFRYGLSVHKLWLDPPEHKTPGIAEGVPSDDFILAPGAFPDGYGSREEQAALFMHELGHTLGLYHGGGDEVNFKPNYPSVMNYLFTYDTLVPGRPLDYSWVRLPTLDEDSLNEFVGIGGAVQTLWNSPSNNPVRSAGNLPIDWNLDGNLTMGVALNLNNHIFADYISPGGEELRGFDDWQNLVYRFRGTRFFAASAVPEFPDELTADVIELMREVGKNLVDTPTPSIQDSKMSFGVEKGDWMEYTISYTGNPPDDFWSKIRIEVEDVQETNITLGWEIELLNGEKISYTETYHLALGVHDLLIISANLEVGDPLYNEQIGIVEIGGIEDYPWAGEERTVVWATSSDGSAHWDQETGILTQADWNYSESLKATWVLEKTNLWGSNKGLDPLLIGGMAATMVAALLLGLFIRKRKKHSQ